MPLNQAYVECLGIYGETKITEWKNKIAELTKSPEQILKLSSAGTMISLVDDMAEQFRSNWGDRAWDEIQVKKELACLQIIEEEPDKNDQINKFFTELVNEIYNKGKI